MLEEPWLTFALIIGGMLFLFAAVLFQDWLTYRAEARRRAREAASHSAE